jgi:hypothetical protein
MQMRVAHLGLIHIRAVGRILENNHKRARDISSVKLLIVMGAEAMPPRWAHLL